jgi:hypothetical protein
MPELTKAAILKSSNSTALGPDGLTSLHLKHLGPRAISYMTTIFNLSIAHANIPAIRKRANMVPIPKPGKAADTSMGYCPVSLLSPVIKILERLLLPYLSELFPSAPTQHGYRAFRSTVTALLPVATKISIGFNEAKPASRTGMVSIDIAMAFDSIDHDLLLEKVAGTNLHSNIVRWLATYLRGQTAICIWQGVVSKPQRCHSGVPQGSVISPQLFNFFVHDFPGHAQLVESHADDFALQESFFDLDELGKKLTSHLEHVVKWAEDNKLSIEPSKCHVTLFTPNTREVNSCPPVFIKGVAIPLNKNRKWLGLNMDPMHKCTYHVDNSSIAKANSHLQLLKAIFGQDFGDKETLLLTYKAYMKPALGYAGVIWFPVVGPEAGCMKRTQRTQNSALRVITRLLRSG